MCVASQMYDYGRQTWPYPPTVPYVPPSPSVITVVEVERIPTPEEWAAFLELVDKARKFDELTKQPDCEDPEKARWFHEMSDRMREAADSLREAADTLTNG